MTYSSFSYKHSSSLTEARVDLQKSIILYYVRYLFVHEIFFRHCDYLVCRNSFLTLHIFTILPLQFFPYIAIQRLALSRTVLMPPRTRSLTHCIQVVLTYPEVSLNSLRVLITHTPKGWCLYACNMYKNDQRQCTSQLAKLNRVFILFPY